MTYDGSAVVFSESRRAVGRGRPGGFSLIELLTVIAIIGVLAAILIPSVNSARASATRMKTRVNYARWAAAIESFRSEYGYYPIFEGNLVNPTGQSTVASAPHRFHDILAGRRRDGSALPAVTSGTPATAAEAQNRKRFAFLSFVDGDFTDSRTSTPNLLRDASGGTEIAVIVDRNLDGMIDASDCGGSLPLVDGIRPSTIDFPEAGVRAGVIFYSPAPGATVRNPRFVFSWK